MLTDRLALSACVLFGARASTCFAKTQEGKVPLDPSVGLAD